MPKVSFRISYPPTSARMVLMRLTLIPACSLSTLRATFVLILWLVAKRLCLPALKTRTLFRSLFLRLSILLHLRTLFRFRLWILLNN